jgi:hypothetical protein
MKMMRRSPDERLRTASDCLSRLWDLRPDPMPIQHERNTFGTNPTYLFKNGLGPGLEPVGGEFQAQFETVYPGGYAHIIFVLNMSRQPEAVLTPDSVAADGLY